MSRGHHLTRSGSQDVRTLATDKTLSKALAFCVIIRKMVTPNGRTWTKKKASAHANMHTYFVSFQHNSMGTNSGASALQQLTAGSCLRWLGLAATIGKMPPPPHFRKTLYCNKSVVNGNVLGGSCEPHSHTAQDGQDLVTYCGVKVTVFPFQKFNFLWSSSAAQESFIKQPAFIHHTMMRHV